MNIFRAVRRRAVILLLPAAFLLATEARAETASDPAVERAAQQIFQELMSPFCPGRRLSDCPSSEAGKLRDEIRDRIIRGASPESIVEELHARYKETRAVPLRRGFGLIGWIAPFAFLAAGVAAWVLWLRRQRGKPEEDAPEIDSAALAEVEAELAKEDASIRGG